MDNDQNEISETIITQGNIETSTQQNNETVTKGDMQQSQQQQHLHRGVKRDVDELNSSSSDHEDIEDSKTGIKPGKKTRGRVKIKMEYIDNKLRRYTTFSKRKTGIMKKAYELSTLTGTQVMLLVASETGHVYTFATRKLQPMITSESGKALIQTCLNSPDPTLNTVALDQRMSATGYEEPDLSYSSHETAVNGDKDGKASIFLNQNIDLNQAGSGSMTGITLQTAGNGSFPMTTYLPPSTTQALNASKSGVQSLSVQTVHGAGYATIFSPPGATFPNGAYQLGSGGQQPLPQVVNPHLHRMQAATTSANSHMDSTVTSHNHHGSPEHGGGESPGHHRHMSGVPINVLSMPGNESSQNNAAVYTSGNMPLIYNSGSLLYATPPTTQNDGDSSVQSHIVMHDGNIVTNQGIPVSLQHVPTQLQVHQEYSNSLQHHSNGMHDNHNSTNEMVGLVDPSSLTVHAEGAMEKNMGSHK